MMLLRKILPLSLFVLCLTATVGSYERLSDAHDKLKAVETEALLLPNGTALDFMSFGYRNVLSHVLWFNTINYFGKHYKLDRNYTWLYHMCDLVTTLNPQATHVYEFGSMMLAWEASLPEKSIALLDKAIRNDNRRWLYYYYRGFIKMFFLNDNRAAQDDFVLASKLPGAHPVVMRLAARSLATTDTPETAKSFLEDLLRTTEDGVAHAALEARLQELQYEIDLEGLEKAVATFRAAQGRAPIDLGELISTGIIGALPPEPFGGSYVWDKEREEVRGTSNRKRLRGTTK